MGKRTATVSPTSPSDGHLAPHMRPVTIQLRDGDRLHALRLPLRLANWLASSWETEVPVGPVAIVEPKLFMDVLENLLVPVRVDRVQRPYGDRGTDEPVNAWSGATPAREVVLEQRLATFAARLCSASWLGYRNGVQGFQHEGYLWPPSDILETLDALAHECGLMSDESVPSPFGLSPVPGLPPLVAKLAAPPLKEN